MYTINYAIASQASDKGKLEKYWLKSNDNPKFLVIR